MEGIYRYGFFCLQKVVLKLRVVNLFCSHVASTAAGNFGVPVVADGFFYGRASGMAPRARFDIPSF